MLLIFLIYRLYYFQTINSISESETTTSEYQEVEEIIETPIQKLDIATLIQSQEFFFFAGIAVIVLISLIIMCAACVASTKKKPRRPPGYDRAATQVPYAFQKIY